MRWKSWKVVYIVLLICKKLSSLSKANQLKDTTAQTLWQFGNANQPTTHLWTGEESKLLGGNPWSIWRIWKLSAHRVEVGFLPTTPEVLDRLAYHKPPCPCKVYIIVYIQLCTLVYVSDSNWRYIRGVCRFKCFSSCHETRFWFFLPWRF